MDSPLWGLIAYLVVMLAVGLWAWGKNATKEDFILGGRRLGAWVIAFSERTAGESAWLILGLSGALFAVGLVELWTILGCVTGIILSWLIIARRLRVMSERYGAITLPEYLHRFAGGQRQAVRIVSMVIIVFFFTLYVAAQFVGGGKVLHTTFGIDPVYGMPLTAAVVVLYTLMGGFVAVCYTDVVQGVLMVFTLVLLPIVGLVLLASRGLELGPALTAAPDLASLTHGQTGWAAAAAIIGGLAWGFGYLGQPHLVTKFMAIRHPAAIRTGRTVAIVWTLLAYGGAAVTGVVGLALLHHGVLPGAGLVGEGGDPERILPVLASLLLPGWLAGILISGAVAAMMSTADSQLLITSSTFVEDFYSRALGRSLSQRSLVRLSRLLTLLVGLFAYGVAVLNTDLIYKLVSYAWSGLGASFGPGLVLSLYWKRFNGTGLLASMITGAVATVVWMELPGCDRTLSVRFVAFGLATLAAVIGSLVTPPRGRNEE